MLRCLIAAAALLVLASPTPSPAAPIRWDFRGDTDGWTAGHDCTVAAADGVLRVASSGPDPFIYSPGIRVQGPVQVRMRARFATSGQARLYWTVMLPSLVPSAWGEGAVVYFDVAHDNQWHEVTVPLDVDGTITQIRLDPGKAAGTAEIDWVSIELLTPTEASAGQGARAAAVTVADGPIRVTVNPAARTLAVQDSRTGRRWRSDRARGVALLSARKLGADRLEVTLRDLASGLPATCLIRARRTGVVSFTLRSDRPDARFSRLSFPPALREALGDGALVFTNRSCGQLIPQNTLDYPVSSLGSYANLGLDMPWVGVIDRRLGDGLMALLETPCDAAIDFIRDGRGNMWPQVRWLPAKGTWAYSRTVSYRLTPSGGYVAQARQYRAYADATGLTVTLAQKARARPRVADLRGTASIWGITGGADRVAPAPRLAQELRAYGISRAILNLSTDVADADIPPINSLGFLTGEYDNYDDFREGPNGITSGPVEPQVLRLAGGVKATGWVNEDGSQMYRRSSAVATDVAREVVPPILKRRPFAARFLDVTSAVDLMEDWDARHGYDRRGDLVNRLRLYRYVGSLGMVVGGEHAKAWTVPVVDYAEGKLSGPFWWEMPAGYLKAPKTRADIKTNYLRWGVNPAVRIPLWELAFHDCMVSTWYWGDCSGYYTEVAPELDDFQDLSTMLYGGVPIYWLNHLGYGWNRHRARMLESYWVCSKLHQATGFARMVSHRFVTADGRVQETRFAGGGVVTVNYGDRPWRVTGSAITLAPRGFAASAPGVLQSRTLVDGSPVTMVRLRDGLMVSTEKLRKVGPVTVRGRVFLFPAGKGATHVVVESSDACRIEIGPGKHRVTRLDDAGAARDLLCTASGTLTIPAGPGLRLYAIDGVVRLP